MEEYASDEEVKGTEVDGLNMTFRHLIQKPATESISIVGTISIVDRFPIDQSMNEAEA